MQMSDHKETITGSTKNFLNKSECVTLSPFIFSNIIRNFVIKNKYVDLIFYFMNNEVLYILLPDYAAHEIVFLSEAIASDDIALKENPKYVNKVVAPTMEPVKSIGSFRTLPDYSFDTMPE